MSSQDWPALSGRRRTQAVLTRIAHHATTRQVQLLLTGSVLCAAALLFRRLDHGWFHHDDGSLAHSAERVLAGELPHRDFTDLYTGLLSFLNAAVFALAGHDTLNLRLPLFVLFLAFAAAFFALTRRLVGDAWAFVATLFAIAWSVPVYPVPIPSWYLLFLSTIGMYAVVRFFETRRRRWLLLAGLCGGIAIALKIAGVWYVVAVVLTLLTQPFQGQHGTQVRAGRSRTYTTVVICSALLALSLAVAVVSGRPGAGEVVGLLLPIAALCGAIALLGWRGTYDRVASLPGEVTTFLVGVSIPIVLLVAPYVATGSVGDLIEGVLIAPQTRFEFASRGMPSPATLLWAIPVVLLFVVRWRVAERWRHRIDVAAATVVVFLAVTASNVVSYSVLWNVTRALAPFVIVLGALVILGRGGRWNGHDPRLTTLVILVGGFSTLLQFPFAAPVYFCYVVPLVLLAAIASMRSLGLANGLLPGVVLLALVLFGVRQLDNQTVLSLGLRYEPDPGVAIIDGDRASIRVPPETKRTYDRVRELVARHRPENRVIFAGPDAPDIYFLTESRNPTPSVLDFLDLSHSTRGRRLIELLKEQDVRVVVINHMSLQSPSLARATLEQIRSMYSGVEHVGNFEVRWRAPRRTRV